MADVYLRSTDGADADNGSTWALADATLAASLTAAGASGRSFMSDNHAETAAAALTETSPGAAGTTTAVICVDDTGDPQPPTALATTGTVSNTGANNISFSGHAAAYGFTVNLSSSSSAAAMNFTSTTSWHWLFRSCAIVLRATAASNRLVAGGTSTSAQEGLLELYSTDVQLNATAQALNPAAMVKWYGGALTLGTAPTGGLIKPLAGTSTLFEARGVDLNNLGANPLMEVGQGAVGGYVDFFNCKLGATFGLTNLSTGTYDGPGHARVRVHNCAGADTEHLLLMEKCGEGTIEATTGTGRQGGAADPALTSFAHRMVSTAAVNFYAPLYSPRYMIPVFVIGSSLTLTVEFVHDSATALKDDDIFVEVEYQGTSGRPLSVFTNTRRAIFGTGTAYGSSTVTWDSFGFANENKQKMTVSFTPNEVGFLYIRVALIKASYTVIIDPPQRAQVA